MWKALRERSRPRLRSISYNIRADRLQERIWLLVNNGLQGLALVLIALFLFLNARVAFWVAVGIPTAVMATLGLMYLSGQSINMISLFAMIMMLGIIVDDAIVVGEHTATKFAEGEAPARAAEIGAGRMFWPVTAANADHGGGVPATVFRARHGRSDHGCIATRGDRRAHCQSDRVVLRVARPSAS